MNTQIFRELPKSYQVVYNVYQLENDQPKLIASSLTLEQSEDFSLKLSDAYNYTSKRIVQQLIN